MNNFSERIHKCFSSDFKPKVSLDDKNKLLNVANMIGDSLKSIENIVDKYAMSHLPYAELKSHGAPIDSSDIYDYLSMILDSLGYKFDIETFRYKR